MLLVLMQSTFTLFLEAGRVALVLAGSQAVSRRGCRQVSVGVIEWRSVRQKISHEPCHTLGISVLCRVMRFCYQWFGLGNRTCPRFSMKLWHASGGRMRHLRNIKTPIREDFVEICLSLAPRSLCGCCEVSLVFATCSTKFCLLLLLQFCFLFFSFPLRFFHPVDSLQFQQVVDSPFDSILDYFFPDLQSLQVLANVLHSTPLEGANWNWGGCHVGVVGQFFLHHS
mmetsp:Transcript_46763/g.100098  ORF Transcript_46763/g.100098 Transcript_46763/m.100098 type:complete len:226 (-) Transcript_46763:995-1672(-)